MCLHLFPAALDTFKVLNLTVFERGRHSPTVATSPTWTLRQGESCAPASQRRRETPVRYPSPDRHDGEHELVHPLSDLLSECALNGRAVGREAVHQLPSSLRIKECHVLAHVVGEQTGSQAARDQLATLVEEPEGDGAGARGWPQ